MAGYLGTKAVLLSTTAASVGGDATIGGDLTVGGGDVTFYEDTGTTAKFFWDASAESLSLTTVGTEALDISSTTGAAEIRMGNSNSTFDLRLGAADKASGHAEFFVETGGTERMRIDANGGNLLVGKTSADFTASGVELRPNGQLFATQTGNYAAVFNRKTSSGDVVSFRKDGTTIGSWQARGGLVTSLVMDPRTNGGGLTATTGGFYVTDNTGQAGSDNTHDWGQATVRFDDIYATNGTIQTSDQNEKQQIASLTDAEITAAKAISKLFKTFKWNDSVAEKGDAARTHTGVIAQEVEQAMTDAGLNAGDYAFFISTTWWETQTEVPAVEADDENGVEAQEAYTRIDTYETAEEAPEGATERNRKGIRYPQLLSFIGAATEQRLASIESRLDALETA